MYYPGLHRSNYSVTLYPLWGAASVERFDRPAWTRNEQAIGAREANKREQARARILLPSRHLSISQNTSGVDDITLRYLKPFGEQTQGESTRALTILSHLTGENSARLASSRSRDRV